MRAALPNSAAAARSVCGAQIRFGSSLAWPPRPGASAMIAEIAFGSAFVSANAPPTAGGMAEYDDGVLANEILLSQEIQRERNFGGRRATRTRVIRLVAAALVLDIAAAGRTMAEPLRHQHGEAACDQK